MLKLGIISLDHPHARGNHIPALLYMKDRVQVTAIYHDDAEAARPWTERFCAKYYDSRDALLADAEVQAVLITSTNNRHAEDCIAAARAKKDIFCDKPIAVCVSDGVHIAQAVRENRVDFITTFPVRFNRAVLRAKRMIEAGALGAIQAIMATNHGCMYEPGVPGWVLDPQKNGGGCIVDHTVHVADLMRWFTGEEFSTVYAEARGGLRPYARAEEIAVMHGTMSGGTLYQIDASWSRRSEDPMWGDVTMRIVGEKGGISLDVYNNQRMEIYTGGEIQLHYPNLVARDHGDVFDDYVRHVSTGAALAGANELDGLRTIELVAAAYESVRLKKTVPVPQSTL